VPLPSLSALPLWRADRLADIARGDAPAAHPTGFAALDAELPGGGWPAAGLTELLLAAPGNGELRLLAPMLATHCASTLWVAPPLLPYAPALAALGLPAQRLVVAQPKRGADGSADAAWAAEQALRAGTLAAVLWWQGAAPVSAPVLRRLHLASVEGCTPLFALRSVSVRTQSSPALLRLILEWQAPGRLAVDVFKRRGPPLAHPLQLDLPVPLLRLRARRAALPAKDSHAVVRPAPERVTA
jgi:protein ImuA